MCIFRNFLSLKNLKITSMFSGRLIKKLGTHQAVRPQYYYILYVCLLT